jgi:hypothetical protein
MRLLVNVEETENNKSRDYPTAFLMIYLFEKMTAIFHSKLCQNSEHSSLAQKWYQVTDFQFAGMTEDKYQGSDPRVSLSQVFLIADKAEVQRQKCEINIQHPSNTLLPVV